MLILKIVYLLGMTIRGHEMIVDSKLYTCLLSLWSLLFYLQIVWIQESSWYTKFWNLVFFFFLPVWIHHLPPRLLTMHEIRLYFIVWLLILIFGFIFFYFPMFLFVFLILFFRSSFGVCTWSCASLFF